MSKNTKRPSTSKRRRINKALDRRFALRNQRAPLPGEGRSSKSLCDLADVPRKNRPARGLRRVQLGETLPQAELASADPVADEPTRQRR